MRRRRYDLREGWGASAAEWGVLDTPLDRRPGRLLNKHRGAFPAKEWRIRRLVTHRGMYGDFPAFRVGPKTFTPQPIYGVWGSWVVGLLFGGGDD